MTDRNDDLWNEAMALLLRWQQSPDDARLREEIRSFCNEGEEQLATWESVKRLYRLTGEATGAPEREEARQRKRDITRRGVLTGLGVIVLGGAALRAPDILRTWGADVVSGVGVIDTRILADGTTLTLGPDSAVQIAFTPTSRTVNLLDGMALFDVADDATRPFMARAGSYVAEAGSGAEFEMRENGGRSLIGVGRGRVNVSLGAKSTATELAAGDWMSGAASGKDVRRGHRDGIAAWRDRKLIADGETVGSVVAEIARWQSSRVVIADWNLGSAVVSGIYDLADPTAALEAVVAPYGGRVRRVTPWLTVVSSV
ncbi:FecR domain-containing protein [Hyphomicrobium sp. D-2]|uniref:FecR family protein n=1 Tax=Hyphomicrobium sp. D-2 TaxID=3041621 RepID=UPI00245643DF|nr:FecR domain-containing protein [Hyphomicrobium sp. D-2]MDH4983710.1 FecR domain-containing protein [Hyphomicrobium sp. D-2]